MMKNILCLMLFFALNSNAQYNGNYLYDASFNLSGYHVSHLGTSLTNTEQSVLECFYLSTNEIITVSKYNGLFNTTVNKPKVILSKYNYNGTLSTSFGTAGHLVAEVNNMDSLTFIGAAQQDDDKILIWLQGVDDYIVRYNPNGTKDNSFAINGNYLVPNTLINPVIPPGLFDNNFRNIISNNNKTLLGGNNASGNPALLMLDNLGVTDLSFNSSGYKEFYSNDPNKSMGQIAVNNNQITVVIENQSQISIDTLFMFRLDMNGLPVSSFGINGYSFSKEFYGGSGLYRCKQIDFYQDGRMVLLTENKYLTNFPLSLLNLYKVNGERDLNWGPCITINPCVKNGTVTTNDMYSAVDIVVDSFNNTYIADINNKGVRKYNSSGILDSSFGGIAVGQFAGLSFTTISGTGYKKAVPYALTFQPNGQLLVAGFTDTLGSQYNSKKNSLFVGRLLESCMNIPIDTLTNTTLCIGDTIKLLCNTNLPKKWYLNNVFTGDTSTTYTATTSGNVYVTITGNGLCDTTSTIPVSLVSLAVPIVTQNGNTLTCNASSVSYQWYDASNVIINGATQSTYTPPAAGIFYVIVTNQLGCENKSALFQFAPNSVFSQELKKGILIFPNPTSQFIQINYSLGDILQLKITNVLGQEVWTSQIVQGINKLDLNEMNLTSSVYYFQLENENNSYTEKVILLNR